MKLIQVGANPRKDSVYNFISNHKEQIELALLVEPIPFIIYKLVYENNI